MIKIGFAGPCMDFIDNPERVFELHNRNEADSFCDSASLVRLSPSSQPDKGRASADVIISRGMDAKPLSKRYPGVPLVELTISACELYHNILQCRERFGARKIAVILPRSMISGFRYLSETLEPEAAFYDLDEKSDRRALLEQAMEDGCECVLSGRRVCRLAGEIGVASMVLRPREDALYNSITEAKRLALRAKRQRETPASPCIVFDHAAWQAQRAAAPARKPRPETKRRGGSVLFFPHESAFQTEREALTSARPSVPNA